MNQGNLVLCGFMGCGKTSVGKRVARLIGWEFCDLDQYIEKKEGMTISEIFQKYGEKSFRQRETQAVREVAQRRDLVVACGGGTVLSEKNVAAFHRGNGIILYLQVPLAALQERLKADTQRPLLQTPNRREVIARLYEERCPLYEAAADQVVFAGAPAVVVAKEIGRRFL